MKSIGFDRGDGTTQTIEEKPDEKPQEIVSMVKINGGTFMMGSHDGTGGINGDEAEPNRLPNETLHSVIVSAFYMSKYQVTQKEWNIVMGTTLEQQQAVATYYDVIVGNGDNFPMYYVSWYDAIVFCNKLSMKEGLTPAYKISGETDSSKWGDILHDSWDASSPWNSVEIVSGSTGYRLPTEAQWEYACRAGTTTAYNTGAEISDNTGWYSANSESTTHEVGKKAANAWGLYDMHGNVWEWCWDRYGTYENGTQTDPTGVVSGTRRVVRGGSWYFHAQDLRSASRNLYTPNYGNTGLGFRLVRPAW